MSLRSGLAGQFGIVAESTFNTGVTVTRFHEFDNEGILPDIRMIDSRGIRAGQRIQRSDRTKTYIAGAAGPASFTLMNKGFGLFMEHAYGSNVVSTPAAGTAKLHTITMDADAAYGKSLTVQVGRPGTGGTVHPFTFTGAKVKTFGISCKVDEPVKLTAGFDAAGVTVATALATASYPSAQEMFIFTEGAVLLNAGALAANAWSMDYDPKLNVNRRFIGGTKKEPVAADYADLGGSLGIEFEDLTMYNRLVAGTVVPLNATFTLATLAQAAHPFRFEVDIPAVQMMPAVPMVDGPDIIGYEAPYRILDNGSDPPFTIEYLTTDSAA